MKNKINSLKFFITIFLVSQVLVYSQTNPNEILLKNYRPKSLYHTPVTNIKNAKYNIIDMHSHPYAIGEEQIAEWVKNMDEVGIEKTIILTYAHGAKFDSIYSLYSKYSDRFELWCGFDYTGYDKSRYGSEAVKELERCYKEGARGIGELGDKGKGLFYCQPAAEGMHIDDPRMDILLEKCGELGMPISIHVADPIWMYETMDSTNDGLMNAYSWRLDDQKDILSSGELLKTLENAVAKHPKTIFIACHLANCSYDLQLIGNLLDKYPNLYADIAARYAETAPVPRYTAKFFNKYQNKLLYGTDMGFDKDMYRITFRILESEDEHFYEIDQFGYHWPLYGLGLNDNVLLKIYRNNAKKIIGK